MHKDRVHHNCKIDTARFEEGKRRSHRCEYARRSLVMCRRELVGVWPGADACPGSFSTISIRRRRHAARACCAPRLARPSGFSSKMLPQRDHPISRTRSNGSYLASHALTGRGGCQDAIHDELNGDDEIRNHALGSAFRVNAEILLQAGLQASLL
jgi:hypothetical protein